MRNGFVWLNQDACFGAVSSTSIFGRPADTLVLILKFAGVDDLMKWVDDYVLFRYPISCCSAGVDTYSYDESLVFSVASDLGWPWSLSKHRPFATSFTCLGGSSGIWKINQLKFPWKRRQNF